MSECRCTHDSELHELGDVAFITGERVGDLRLKWRWQCSGNYQNDPQAQYPIPCQCTNFELKGDTEWTQGSERPASPPPLQEPQ